MPEADMLETLRAYPFLAQFNLYLYHDSGEQCNGAPRFRIGGINEYTSIIPFLWQTSVEEAVMRASTEKKPIVHRGQTGLLFFAIPLGEGATCSEYLVGLGVREKSINLWQMEVIARSQHTDPFTLLEEIEKLPTSSIQEVEKLTDRILDVLPRSTMRKTPTLLSGFSLDKLEAIVGISSELDSLTNTEEVLSLLGETLGILFEAPRIAFVTPDKAQRNGTIRGMWGLPESLGTMSISKLKGFIPAPNKTFTVAAYEISPLLPTNNGRNAFCVPIMVGDELLGMVILLEIDISSQDALLIQLISGKAAMKLLHLRREEELIHENSLSRKLISMVSALSLTESSTELYRNILDMATNLLRSASGSIMLLDQAGDHLRIEAVKGMNPQVARNMNIKATTGIAGKVLASGNPLLVNDIENDQRIGFPNRPRFRTKSFISHPIKLRDITIGVINLADKENNAIFNEDDLKVLSSFITHASVMIERSRSVEENSLLEKLSVTDPLTGLYNRRFQVRRMEEEISRSTRQDTNLTVMLIDLDNFKMYNDLCGHVAGDRALKKVADILRESVREMDVVTRYGGEEFCVILPGTTKKESLFVAERIRHGIENELFPGEENLPRGSLTCSIGISCFPDDGSTPISLINSSDIALYQAKSQGRNRIVLFTSELAPNHSSVAPLHEALAHQSLS
jgi:diguanylate cyclase (GGDEF)-like protein